MTNGSFQKPAAKASQPRPTRVILTGVRSAVIGPNIIIDAYRTAVATIIVGLDSDVALRVKDNSDVEANYNPVVLIPPSTFCELQSDGEIAIIFCDALSDDYNQVDFIDLNLKIKRLRDLLKRGPKNKTPEQFLKEVFVELGVKSSRRIRPDIRRVVSVLGREPERFDNVEIAAEIAGLSPMRFQHVFTETLGMPFRRYRQWRRMGRVIRSMADGKTLTEAAYASGFSNSAHLSTAFKAMFGLRPSDLFTNNIEYYLSDVVEDPINS